MKKLAKIAVILSIISITCFATSCSNGSSGGSSNGNNETNNGTNTTTKYHVIYDLNGITMQAPVDETDYTAGSELTVTDTILSKGDNYCIGWTLNSDGSGTVYKGGDTLHFENRDITLFAKWVSLALPVKSRLLADDLKDLVGLKGKVVFSVNWGSGARNRATINYTSNSIGTSTYSTSDNAIVTIESNTFTILDDGELSICFEYEQDGRWSTSGSKTVVGVRFIPEQ